MDVDDLAVTLDDVTVEVEIEVGVGALPRATVASVKLVDRRGWVTCCRGVKECDCGLVE